MEAFPAGPLPLFLGLLDLRFQIINHFPQPIPLPLFGTQPRCIAADFNHLFPPSFEGSQGQKAENRLYFMLSLPQLPVLIDLAGRKSRIFRVRNQARNLGNWGSMGNGFNSVGYQRHCRIPAL